MTLAGQYMVAVWSTLRRTTTSTVVLWISLRSSPTDSSDSPTTQQRWPAAGGTQVHNCKSVLSYSYLSEVWAVTAHSSQSQSQSHCSRLARYVWWDGSADNGDQSVVSFAVVSGSCTQFCTVWLAADPWLIKTSSKKL